MIGDFCRSIKLGIRTGYDASRGAYQATRLDSRHTNWTGLWTNAPRPTCSRRIASSIFRRLPLTRETRRTPRISFTTTANLEDELSRCRASKSSSLQPLDSRSLGLIGWVPPYMPPSLNNVDDCQTKLDAIVIGETKCRDVITKLDARQHSYETSVSQVLQFPSIS